MVQVRERRERGMASDEVITMHCILGMATTQDKLWRDPSVLLSKHSGSTEGTFSRRVARRN